MIKAEESDTRTDEFKFADLEECVIQRTLLD